MLEKIFFAVQGDVALYKMKDKTFEQLTLKEKAKLERLSLQDLIHPNLKVLKARLDLDNASGRMYSHKHC